MLSRNRANSAGASSGRYSRSVTKLRPPVAEREAPLLRFLFLSLAKLPEKCNRVEDIGAGLLQPTTNNLRVDFCGVTEHGLRCPVFAHRFKASLVERLSIPKQEVYGLCRRV